jgi:hypothetical protein
MYDSSIDTALFVWNPYAEVSTLTALHTVYEKEHRTSRHFSFLKSEVETNECESH